MNFLAHSFLSGEDKELLIGNFLGDFVNGSLNKLDFSEKIKEGIKLHRDIDSFTDSHEIFIRSKRRLNKDFGHYKGVMLDMFYDHFLAKNWNKFHKEDLSIYSKLVYKTLYDYYDILPENLKTFLYYMEKEDFLYSYKNIESIHSAFIRIGQRRKKAKVLLNGLDELKEHYNDLEQDFFEFFSDIKEKFL